MQLYTFRDRVHHLCLYMQLYMLRDRVHHLYVSTCSYTRLEIECTIPMSLYAAIHVQRYVECTISMSLHAAIHAQRQSAPSLCLYMQLYMFRGRVHHLYVSTCSYTRSETECTIPTYVSTCSYTCYTIP